MAVDRVDVAIHKGELRSIIGSNGAGKTTFFRLISGEMTPTSGRIWFDERDITGLPQHAVASPGPTRSPTSSRTSPCTRTSGSPPKARSRVRLLVAGRPPRRARPGDRPAADGRPRRQGRPVGRAPVPRREAAHILQGVSLRLEEGEVVTLIGRNCAGKTTILRSIMGVARPSRGRVVLRGVDLARLATHEIARLGIAWIPEERRILPNPTVLENLRLGMLGRASRGADGALEEVFDYFPRLRERMEQSGQVLHDQRRQPERRTSCGAIPPSSSASWRCSR